MSLASPDTRDGPWVQRRQICRGDVSIIRSAEKIAFRRGDVGVSRGSIKRVKVRRHFALCQRVRLLAGPLAEGVAVAHVNRHAPSQVWQREVDAPVAAVSRAE